MKFDKGQDRETDDQVPRSSERAPADMRTRLPDRVVPASALLPLGDIPREVVNARIDRKPDRNAGDHRRPDVDRNVRPAHPANDATESAECSKRSETTPKPRLRNAEPHAQRHPRHGDEARSRSGPPSGWRSGSRGARKALVAWASGNTSGGSLRRGGSAPASPRPAAAQRPAGRSASGCLVAVVERGMYSAAIRTSSFRPCSGARPRRQDDEIEAPPLIGTTFVKPILCGVLSRSGSSVARPLTFCEELRRRPCQSGRGNSLPSSHAAEPRIRRTCWARYDGAPLAEVRWLKSVSTVGAGNSPDPDRSRARMVRTGRETRMGARPSPQSRRRCPARPAASPGVCRGSVS